MHLRQFAVHRSTPRVVKTPTLTARYPTCSHHSLILNEAVASRVADTMAPSSADCDEPLTRQLSTPRLSTGQMAEGLVHRHSRTFCTRVGTIPRAAWRKIQGCSGARAGLPDQQHHTLAD